jgi:hypothetical protein
MKKTIHDIFDEATSAEMDHLISKSDAPDVSAKTRERIKDKAYIKAGLAAPQKKNSVEVIGRYVAAAACLCMMIGVVLFAVSIFNFDGVSPKENTEQDKELSQGGASEENDSWQQGGPSGDGTSEEGSSGADVTENTDLPTLILDNSETVMIEVGNSIDIWDYIIEAENYDQIRFWATSECVAVDQNGKVTMCDTLPSWDEVYVFAKNEAGTVKSSLKVRTAEPTVEFEIIALKDMIRISLGETVDIDEFIFTDEEHLAYGSTQPNIATVDSDGNLKTFGIGSTTIRIYAVIDGMQYLGETIHVVVYEPWEPTDPISQEVLAAKKTLNCYRTFDWFMTNISRLPQYNIRGDKNTTAGPVEICSNTLQMDLRFLVGINGETWESSNCYFDIFYRPYDENNNRGDYKKATLQPWSIYTGMSAAVYFCKFYDQFFVENDGLVEDQKYEVVIVIREGDKQLGYAESEFTWTDSCAIFTEYAEAHPEIIK